MRVIPNSSSRLPSWSMLQIALTTALILVSGCTRVEKSEDDGTTREPLDAIQMREDLAQYRDTVLGAWSYLESKQADQGVDIQRSHDFLSKQISNTTTEREFCLLLRAFAAALHDGHSYAFTNDLPEPFAFSWPIGCRLIRDEVTVSSLAYLKNNPGIEIGDVLIAVDGLPIAEHLAKRISYTSASTRQAQKAAAVDQIFRCGSPQVELQLKKSSGKTNTFELPCIPEWLSFQKQEEFCAFKNLPDEIGYIRIPKFVFDSEAYFRAASDADRNALLSPARSQIDKVFASANSKRGVILDLRGNVGGLELLSSYVAEHLVAGDFKYYDLERPDSPLVRSLDQYKGHPTEAFGTRIEEYPKQWTSFDHYEGPIFEGRLIVLIDERCFSTTDNLCAFLRDVRTDTKFIGAPTNGGTGEPCMVATLKHSRTKVQFCVSRIYSPSGRLIEGSGTTPDVLVDLQREDFIAGKDTILERALLEMERWE